MQLEDEQYELLAKFVEAHLSTPQESRGSFIATWPHNDTQATFFHSREQSLRFEGSMSDAEILAHGGFLLKSSGSRGSVTFSVLPQGVDAYRKRRGLSLPRHEASAEPQRDLDVFLSHASEDKQSIARPLYEVLVAKGWKVWLDEAVLELGDSLRQKIDEGLSKCRYGVVVLSPSFFQKEWPRRELDGLVARETSSGNKAILPIWHNIDHSGVAAHSPMLADRFAGRSSEGVDALAEKIAAVLQKEGSPANPGLEHALKIVFDEAHRQEEWYVKPCVELDYSLAGRASSDHYKVLPYRRGKFSPDVMSTWDILVLPIPYGTLLDEAECQAIAKWVYMGGGLLLCGFYFMEAHLYTNFNMLATKMDIQFHEDLIMPLGRESREDILEQAFPVSNEFRVGTAPQASTGAHPILEGVARIALPSSCSLEATRQDSELQVATNTAVTLVIPKGRRPGGPRTKILQILSYDLQQGSHPTFLVAVNHGRGRVVAVGTWKIFVDHYMRDHQYDNATLFSNIIRWLARRPPPCYS